ncbi:MAG: hypothetical protein M1832_000610 [Thelocarpon impressellum]|nr:MAG: hypothetical protein M1832_000610 [Thelocarpon impressellum]
MAALGGPDVSAVKVEPGTALSGVGEPRIKPDPDSVGASPVPLSEDDIYEDTGDLDFSHIDPSVYLMRVPKYIWENWSKIGDDEDIKLGTVRVEKLGQGQDGKEKTKFTMLLSPSVEVNRGLPKEYNVQLTNPDSTNTYIFTEKDLPGYKGRGRGQMGMGGRGGFAKGPQPQGGPKPGDKGMGRGQPRWERGRRGQPYYKKAIPKQTALTGVVKHEMTCVPVNVDEETRYLEQKARKSTKPKETIFLSGMGPAAGNLLDPGTIGSGGGFNKFIKTSRGPQKGKPQETKNARIPQNELFDLIYECFSRYTYWPFKTLKAELNQPDQYLKETLEVVAELVKTGRFAMTWTLKPSNRVAQYADIKEELAPDADDGGADDEGAELDDDDEEDTKMEDVLPG